MLLVDSYHRRFHYLRLSVTDRCNYRCTYCLPNGYQGSSPEPDLSLAEIEVLIKAFVRLGIRKVRLTGGEPTLRRDIVEIAQLIKQTQGIEEVALSTNGYRLRGLAKPLIDAGVKSVNISMDSLDGHIFKSITGIGKLEHVTEGFERVLEYGFEKIKVNVVLLKNQNAHELESFQEWVRTRPVSVRFIELMRTNNNQAYFTKHHLSLNSFREQLSNSGWSLKTKKLTDGPAQVFGHPDYMGSIGLIAPYSPGFCEGCNRLRVTSRGALKLCLFGEGESSLRAYLGDSLMQDQLVEKVRELVSQKPMAHFLHENRSGNTISFSQLGG